MSSERVRLEVAILAADGLIKNAPSPHDGAITVTILTISADADVRRYVQECLRDRVNVRVVGAATPSDGLALAANEKPRVLVMDGAPGDIPAGLADVRAVVLVDELPYGDQSEHSHVRFVARPFTAARLLDEVDRMLS